MLDGEHINALFKKMENNNKKLKENSLTKKKEALKEDSLKKKEEALKKQEEQFKKLEKEELAKEILLKFDLLFMGWKFLDSLNLEELKKLNEEIQKSPEMLYREIPVCPKYKTKTFSNIISTTKYRNLWYYKKLNDNEAKKIDSLATKIGLNIISDFLELDITNPAIKNFKFINNITEEEKSVFLKFKSIISNSI